TYYSSGDYTQNLQSVHGCDSIVTLHLTINDNFNEEDTKESCESFTWYDSTYYVSGDYQQIFYTVHGCDSIYTLHLTVNNIYNEEQTLESCESFTWNDSTYYVSGDYIQNFQSIHGCDSIVTLHLTINEIFNEEQTQESCESYTWNGTEYTESGDYIQNLQSVHGCDSIVTLHLTINDVQTSEWEHLACDSYIWNDIEYTESGGYQQTLESVHGCDSIVYLQLTIEHIPDVPAVEGRENVYVGTDLVTGIYHYEADSLPNAKHYEWSLAGVDWLMDTIGTSCNLNVIDPGTGILTLRAWNECGYTEAQKTITAGFFDVGEQETVNVNVYPNPTKYKAVVESEGITRIRIYSMKGQLLQEINGSGDDRVEVNLRNLIQASYLLEVTTRKGVANVILNVVG
ncbi:MAG: T9SS type A sorting domain-containing protein, partial [Bacteroidia bacterium]|nr:T9SS type A sorting domain-containing protein [Bacteroidia bacterium]